MRKVVPYRSFHGAARALDNGGRFFNLFTRAGDRVLTRAELSRVAGLTGGLTGALLFFEMAIWELDESERAQLARMMDPGLRRRHRTGRPMPLPPARFATEAVAGKPFIVEGHTVPTGDETQVTAYVRIPIMIGSVTTYTLVPVTDAYDVFRVVDAPGGGGDRCLLTVKRGSGADSWGRVRWGGVAKEHSESKESGSGKRLFLEPAYYTRLD